MTRHRSDGPGGDAGPLERFRARLVVWGLGTIAIVSFAVALWTIVWGGRP